MNECKRHMLHLPAEIKCIAETREKYPYCCIEYIQLAIYHIFSLLATFLLTFLPPFFLSPPLLISVDHHFVQTSSIFPCKIPFPSAQLQNKKPLFLHNVVAHFSHARSTIGCLYLRANPKASIRSWEPDA